MSAHPPPVPPEQTAKKGPEASPVQNAKRPKDGFESHEQNTAEQGRSGNTKQNTTNKGLQQDR